MGVVWILGAGFSRPLGGPLMKDFFAAPLLRKIQSRFGQDNVALRDAWRLLTSHFGEPQGPQQPWRDAEEFLALIDAARRNPHGPEEALLGQRLAPDVDTVARWARSYLAAACSHFLPEPEALVSSLETWRPYLDWAKSLTTEDTVVTFNYDRVVEIAAEVEQSNPSVRALPPGVLPDPSLPNIPVYKLHGSVTWSRPKDGAPIDVTDARTFLSDERIVAIAGPGPSKLEEQKSGFASLWDAAVMAIEKADVIVIVGYRFPETDAEAKRVLLGAVRRAGEETKHLRIRVVLGPDQHDRDLVRVVGLLRWALSDRRVQVELGPSRHTTRAVRPRTNSRHPSA